MSTETQRAEFEVWFRREHPDWVGQLDRTYAADGGYMHEARRLWRAWQAAQASQAAELAALKADIAEHVRITAERATEIEALRKDAERWRHWREGRGLQVVVPTPTDEKPDKVTTIIYGPCREPGYGEALDAAIDAAMQT